MMHFVMHPLTNCVVNFWYQEIPWDQHASWDVAMADENKGKNRFLNILACEFI